MHQSDIFWWTFEQTMFRFNFHAVLKCVEKNFIKTCTNLKGEIPTYYPHHQKCQEFSFWTRDREYVTCVSLIFTSWQEQGSMIKSNHSKMSKVTRSTYFRYEDTCWRQYACPHTLLFSWSGQLKRWHCMSVKIWVFSDLTWPTWQIQRQRQRKT